MKRSLPYIFAALSLCVLGPVATQAQETQEQRIQRLEDTVRQLAEANQALTSKVEELEAKQGGEGEQDLKSQIEAIAYQCDPTTFATKKPLYRRNGGFIENMEIGGEWRTRVDYRNNTVDLLDKTDDEGLRLDYRFNLGFGFNFRTDQSTEGHHVPNIRTWFEFQAAGRGANNTAENIATGNFPSAGEFSTRDNDLDFIRLYQAYIAFDNMFDVSGLNFVIGRQEINLGSGLLVGTNEFFTGTVHDALRLDFDISGLPGKFTTFYSKEASSDGQFATGFSTGGILTSRFRSSGDEDELMGFYYGDNDWAEIFKFDLYYIYFNARSSNGTIRPDNVTSPNDPAVDAFGLNTLGGQIHTLGTWLHGEDIFTDGLYLGVEFAYQLGDDENGNERDAALVEFVSEYKLPIDETDIRLFFAYYFAEGDDPSDRLSQNGFKTLFISRHNNEPVFSRHGPYSRFGNVDMIPSENVHVFQGGFKFEPWNNWLMGMTYLFAMANHSERPFTKSALGNVFLDERNIGHEIDFWAKYDIGAATDLFLNLSVFIPVSDFKVLDFNENFQTSNNFSTEETDVAVGLYAQFRVRF